MHVNVSIQTLQYLAGAPEMLALFNILAESLLKSGAEKVFLLMTGGIQDDLGHLVGHVSVKNQDEEYPREVLLKWEQRKHDDGRLWGCFSIRKRNPEGGRSLPEFETPSVDDIADQILLQKLKIRRDGTPVSKED